MKQSAERTMFKTLARISLLLTGVLLILGVISWAVPGDFILVWRTHFEIAHFLVLASVAFILMHIAELKEK